MVHLQALRLHRQQSAEPLHQAAAQHSTQQTLDALYERHAADIYTYLLARTASAEDAADLTQQVFLQALDALPRYQDRGSPMAAWLFRIARNLAVDAHRRHRPTTSWDLMPETFHSVDERDTETLAIERDAVVRILHLVDALDAPKRELVLLRFAAGLKIREIASVLNRSESAVKTELSRILRALKEQYGEEERAY